MLDPTTGKSSVWFKGLKGELDVRIASFPEFGVNGVAFSKDGRELYMANMSTDIIYRMPLIDCGGEDQCQPGNLSVFAKGQGINGPDNIYFDDDGLLWVRPGRTTGWSPSTATAGWSRKSGSSRADPRRRARRAAAAVRDRREQRPRLYLQRVEPRFAPDAGPGGRRHLGSLRLFTITEIRPFIRR